MLEKLMERNRLMLFALFCLSVDKPSCDAISMSGESGSYCGVLTCSLQPKYIGNVIPSAFGISFPS